ncbi:MAG TPA: carboxypeptidase regulatory-like domain-containing protein, partial [Myxococcus sp.]|nr:carboxypeptidase regulatory-like domain-containing protein [Myxococcus sp.]
AEACVGAGEKKELKVELDGDSDGRGCAPTGCEDGLVCAPHGRCVECADDSQCGEGLTCKGFRCEGPGEQCAPCDGDWKCQQGASCQEVSGSGAVCVAGCRASADCDAGFTCQGSQCLPDAARFSGCQALLQLNTPCDGDAVCRGQGLADGLCVDGACTVPCDSDRDCPGSLRCLDSAAGRVCRPRR